MTQLEVGLGLDITGKFNRRPVARPAHPFPPGALSAMGTSLGRLAQPHRDDTGEHRMIEPLRRPVAGSRSAHGAPRQTCALNETIVPTMIYRTCCYIVGHAIAH